VSKTKAYQDYTCGVSWCYSDIRRHKEIRIRDFIKLFRKTNEQHKFSFKLIEDERSFADIRNVGCTCNAPRSSFHYQHVLHKLVHIMSSCHLIGSVSRLLSTAGILHSELNRSPWRSLLHVLPLWHAAFTGDAGYILLLHGNMSRLLLLLQ